MSTTPLAAIADALIEFILSLLGDPAAAADFAADPDSSLARAGLTGVGGADVRSVVPVVIDHPSIVERPVVIINPGVSYPPSIHQPEVVRQITTLMNSYTIDARTTIVDQSVNQSIWTEGGDVTQLFDQEAVLATGDQAVAAGDDAMVDNSQTDLQTGDIAVGNTTTDVVVENSFNDQSVAVDTVSEADTNESHNDASSSTTTTTEVDNSFNQDTDVDVDDSSDVRVEVSHEPEAELDNDAAPQRDEPAAEPEHVEPERIVVEAADAPESSSDNDTEADDALTEQALDQADDPLAANYDADDLVDDVPLDPDFDES